MRGVICYLYTSITFLEPTVNIVLHYSEKDNTLTKVIVRGINLGVGHPPYVVKFIVCTAQCMIVVLLNTDCKVSRKDYIHNRV